MHATYEINFNSLLQITKILQPNMYKVIHKHCIKMNLKVMHCILAYILEMVDHTI